MYVPTSTNAICAPVKCYLNILSVIGAWSEHEALVSIGAYHTTETVGSVSDACGQNLALQEGIDDTTLPIAGPTKECNLGVWCVVCVCACVCVCVCACVHVCVCVCVFSWCILTLASFPGLRPAFAACRESLGVRLHSHI